MFHNTLSLTSLLLQSLKSLHKLSSSDMHSLQQFKPLHDLRDLRHHGKALLQHIVQLIEFPEGLVKHMLLPEILLNSFKLCTYFPCLLVKLLHSL